MPIQQFDLLQKSAVINIQADLEAAVAADTLLASEWASKPENSVVANGKYSSLHYMEKSKDWAENPENVAVESGLYSSKHHAIKSAASAVLSSDWAEKAEDSQVTTGKYSSKHWAAKAEDEKLAAEVHKNKSDKFANENEDVLVETGKYSAKHYSLKAAAQNAQMGAVYPTAAYRSRVLADLGNIHDLNKLTELYIKNLQLLDSTVFLWSGVSGMKTRTSGSNVFASKLYNMANKVQQFGPELVTNGTFTTDTTGWTSVGGAVLAIDSNRLKVTNTLEVTGNARQTITTVIGKTYHFTFTGIAGDVNPTVFLGSISGGSDIYNSGSFTGTRTISFIATTTSVFIRLNVGSITPENFCFFDNISVKQMDWIEGTNDAVQTTEANQPYVGVVIAPNEVRKLKNLSVSEDRKMSISAIEFADNSSFSISFNCKLLTNTTEQVIIGYAQSSGFSRISIFGFGLNIRNRYGGSDVVISNIYTNSEIGKSIQFTLVYSNGVYSLYKNGVYFNSISGTGGALYNQLFVAGNTTLDFVSELIHLQIHNRALSASEIQAQHDYLRSQIPEIEGVAIGNQYWATSNYEGVVAGDGSVIPEVKGATTDGNAEMVINGSFDVDPLFYWSTANSTQVWDAVNLWQTVTTNAPDVGFGLVKIDIGITPGKLYRVRFKAKSSVAGLGVISIGDNGNVKYATSNPLTTTAFQDYEFYIKPTSTDLRLYFFAAVAGTTLTYDDISVKEVDWSQSTTLYDAVYAQTSGSTAVKELAALKAAAMWCYYNNDVNNGAIYGKLYNWYAVKLISLYPPQGWRVPLCADFEQLANYLGGSTVAGGKLKALYGEFNNSFATNESGFSLIAGGARDENGMFHGFAQSGILWTSDNVDESIGIFYAGSFTSNALSTYVALKKRGYALRLLRNSPVGLNERTITSTTIVSDIASTANSTQIPFGYSVASIRLKTTANLTNIKVELWNNYSNGLSPALVATLITSKTANNTAMVFPVLADVTSLLQDGTLRITATHNGGYVAGTETVVEYNLQKNTF